VWLRLRAAGGDWTPGWNLATGRQANFSLSWAHEAHPKSTLCGVVFQKLNGPTLAFEERLALLVDREATEREKKRLISRLRFAGLRQNAVVEDIDMKAPRGLDKARCSKSSSPASGSNGTRTCSSSAPPALARLDCVRPRPQGLLG
jgi:IstB-like ATP binding protein